MGRKNIGCNLKIESLRVVCDVRSGNTIGKNDVRINS